MVHDLLKKTKILIFTIIKRKCNSMFTILRVPSHNDQIQYSSFLVNQIDDELIIIYFWSSISWAYRIADIYFCYSCIVSNKTKLDFFLSRSSYNMMIYSITKFISKSCTTIILTYQFIQNILEWGDKSGSHQKTLTKRKRTPKFDKIVVGSIFVEC